MTSQVPIPRPLYSKARESLVKAVPPQVICILACGGTDCRYEGPACWSMNQQAIKGVFSSWMTDDIIAMARPSTHLIKRFSIIQQFKQMNIKSIINLQCSGEHAHCGPALEPESGFTYSPQIFMDSQIYFYNFGMCDFGVSSLEETLSAVKVLLFSVREGKVAVHCHAGLGRTGVLIACYLVYTCGISASEAVHYVRIKRPRSIQTRSQINLVFDFARLVASKLTQFPRLNMRHGSTFSLHQYLRRQAFLLHGEEARTLMYTPKILHMLCSMLITLTQQTPNPPEIQRELEKRVTVLALQKAVRETLSKRNLNALRKRRGSCRKFSCKSWDEPFGFLERKREILLNKRSYSESDLSKMTIIEDFTQFSDQSGGYHNIYNEEIGRSGGQKITDSKQNVNNDVLITDQSKRLTEKHCPPSAGCLCHDALSTMKKPQALLKFSSSVELLRECETSEQASLSKAVAMAMSQQRPAPDSVLRRAEVLQGELNSSECGWAVLGLEDDPEVLSTLLWTWLDKLKNPVLNKDDTDKLTSSSSAQNPLTTLHRAERHTICCLLLCVGHAVAQWPQFEHIILQRLIRALTGRPPEEIERNSILLEVMRATMRELYLHKRPEHVKTINSLSNSLTDAV